MNGLYDSAADRVSSRVCVNRPPLTILPSSSLRTRHTFSLETLHALPLGAPAPARSLFPMPRHAHSSPEGDAARSWVWHATLRSRSAGKVSVLACAEALLAVAVYAWLALRWDITWPLLGSVFLAPLLLLRSPQSIKLGTRWFLQDGFEVKEYQDWPKAKRRCCVAGAVVLGCVIAYALTRWLGEFLSVDINDLPLLCSVPPNAHLDPLLRVLLELLSDALCVSIAIDLGLAFAVAFLGADVGTKVAVKVVAFAGKVLNAFAVTALTFNYVVAELGSRTLTFMFAGIVRLSLTTVLATVFLLTAAILGTALGLTLRAIVCRVAATLRHLPQGLRWLAENWHETTFRIDSTLTAELMPGLRPEFESLAPHSLALRTAQSQRRVVRWLVAPSLAVLCFIPALIYRLQIKAACWFWWPLAYLLKPALPADRREAQQLLLCWPWAMRSHRLLVLIPALVPAVLVCAILIARFGQLDLWQQIKHADARTVPAPLQLVLGMQWRGVPPWHWALLLTQICGLGMLWIADGACSHRAKGTWTAYAKTRMRPHYRRLRLLFRLRQWATIAFLLCGLGLCLVSFTELHPHLPAALLQRLDLYYQTGELHAPAVPTLPALSSSPAPTPASATP